MSWGPKGRAFVDWNNPDSFAFCDRCGFRYNHSKLQFQFEWMGPRLQNTNFLVCQRCLDKPNPGNRPVNPGPDPVPIRNPRPFNRDEMYTGGPFWTEDGLPIMTQNSKELFPEDYPGPTELEPYPLFED